MMKIITVSSAHVPRFNAQSDRLIYVGISSVQAFEFLDRQEGLTQSSISLWPLPPQKLWPYGGIEACIFIYLFTYLGTLQMYG